ncbi:SMC5-SMC6 complex localization factor protein 2 [Eublepharis macularius]|uniref:SMC5-SMC6 complex localization factor protein 2 n=1 Tax=Eublepharis macularius TaxID=481883 RepID=A0AA97JM65_EUBMA|nr:SMC5-SMC6 complex localization factor protein 2 [Eublepharis macularius]
MTQFLNSSQSSERDGRAPWDSLGSPAGLSCKRAGRADSARNGRNQCITDFFQPVPKQDRAVLCSPEKRNGKFGLANSYADSPGRNISSPKQNRRKKFPPPPPDRSPIIDAFLKGAKIKKKDSSNDDAAYVAVKATYPKVVVRKLFTLEGSSDCPFKDDTCLRGLEKSEIHLLPTTAPLVENHRECKMEYMDLDTTSSGLSKWASASENESHISWCQKTACSETLQPSPANASLQSSLETLGRNKKAKKEKKMLFNQQPSSSAKESLATSVSQQNTMDLLRKRLCSASCESSTDESSTTQASKVAVSSRQLSNKAINTRRCQSCPSVCAYSRTSLGISRYKEHPEKRKRISSNSNLKNLQKLALQSLDTHNFSGLLEKHNSEHARSRTSPGGEEELKDRNPTDSDLPLSTQYLDGCEENGNHDSYKKIRPLPVGCIANKNNPVHTTDAKEGQSQTVISNSYLEQMLPSCPEQIGVKAPSNILITSEENSLFFQESKDVISHIQNDNLFQALQMNIDDKGLPLSVSDSFPSTSHNSFSKVETQKTLKDTSNNVLSSVDCDHVATPPFSHDLNKLSNEDSNLEMSVSNKKLKSLSDSEDENPDCSLGNSDDEILLPFEDILAQSSKPTKNPEPTSDEDNIQDTMIQSHTSFLSKPSAGTQVSYINQLERLLKEKEEFRRVDELEKQLQHVKRQVERDLSSEELSKDGELSAEHRAFIERFSVIDVIPDQHPGENIFQMAHAGKIFNQRNLDLRNYGFFPHSPIEKYLLGSGITQQLFVINEGLLMSAYYSSPCPVPILKWMFQMMSVHSDRSVSKKILDMLMALTITNASVSDPLRPWIPSLCDIATVLTNMGIPFNTLFPLLDFQPPFNKDNIMCEMYKTVGKQESGDFSENMTSFFLLVQSSLCNMAKFLQLCIGICPEHYTDEEILLLLLLLFKVSLEKELKQFPLVDLEYLIIKLLENIRKWDTEMPKLCLAISCLSSHHHDLLWLVQFVPNWTARGRQVRRRLSLVVISKLLKNDVNIPCSQDQQMALLCQDLVKMKPSTLLKRTAEKVKQQSGLSKESLLSEFEPQAYYLTYILLHLVREASNTEAAYSNQRKWLLKLCATLEKYVKSDIREDARLFYRTKVKDLVARTYSKWQQMIHSSRPTQGKIHDFWDPDS